jgi:hypothetical protein
MRRIGLFVGLNRVNPASYSGFDGILQGAVADAVALSGIFAQGGMESRLLLDTSATLGALVGELTLAAEELVDGDAFVWSFSGHGSADLDVTESICLFDGELTDKRLHNLMAAFKPGVRVVSIFDSCFSGGMNRALGIRHRFKPPGFPAKRRALTAATDVIQADILQLDACTQQEEAAEDSAHGYFTGSLLDAIKPGISWKEWMTAASLITTERNGFQHPVAHQLGPKTVYLSPVFTFDLTDTPPEVPAGFPPNPGPS